MDKIFLKTIEEETKEVISELLEVAKLKENDILVVGCSSSEVLKEKIGTNSSYEVGETILNALLEVANKNKIFIAAQCCEHLNRAIVVEEKVLEKYDFIRVNVVPVLKAGGSFSTAAYSNFKNPIVIESLKNKAKAGIDIGDTIIGMHLSDVVVPVRVKRKEIGKAHITCARTRYKYIGGERANYNLQLS